MRKGKFILFSLYGFISLIFFSCKKEQMDKMKNGKYEMTNILVFPNGTQDTIRSLVYGPRLLKGHYYFTTEINNNEMDYIDIHPTYRKMITTWPFKKTQHSVNILFNFKNYSLPGKHYSYAEFYDIQESELFVIYRNEKVISSLQQDSLLYTGSLHLKWVAL